MRSSNPTADVNVGDTVQPTLSIDLDNIAQPRDEVIDVGCDESLAGEYGGDNIAGDFISVNSEAGGKA